MRTRDAIAAFKAVLRDREGCVRLAGALGLAAWGIAEGQKELAIATNLFVLQACEGTALRCHYAGPPFSDTDWRRITGNAVK